MIDVNLICKTAKEASYKLAGTASADKNAMLSAIAEALGKKEVANTLKEANALDISVAKDAGRDETFIDRLTLTDKRIAGMTEGLLQIIALDDPVGEIVEERTLYNGLDLKRVRAPLGVIGIIYEARPNVTVDAAALCLKSGNAVVLRGSREALNSNRALYRVMKDALKSAGHDANVIGFIDDASREASKVMLGEEEYIDVMIPRGGEGLKRFVLENAKMPVIASAGGNCHVYVDKTADLNNAVNIAVNAKAQRPSVCNAAEHLLIDEAAAVEFLPVICAALREKGVRLLGDAKARSIAPWLEIASKVDYATEFLSLTMTVSVVSGVKEAVNIINKYGTKHSEAIVSNDAAAEEYFAKYVDAAAVYVNASTRFTDGFEFGLGAEMGISTQKLHARGPVALRELTSVKYVVTGNGQVRQ